MNAGVIEFPTSKSKSSSDFFVSVLNGRFLFLEGGSFR